MKRLVLLLAGLWAVNCAYGFEGKRALSYIQAQMEMGPRYPTSEGHKKLRAWIKQTLAPLEAKVEVDRFSYRDAHQATYLLENWVFRFAPEAKRRIILGAHYDSRRFADKDPDDPYAPLMGANDAASGVAVLLELAPQLKDLLKGRDLGVDLVFFDAEEGELDPKARAWQPIGSVHFAKQLKQFYPQQPPWLVVVVDMVCDKDLQLKMERFSLESAPKEVWKIWGLGATRSPGFIQDYGYRVYDDHYPLIQAGVPGVLLIDFDYPPWHTQADVIDQCSAASLEAVGSTLESYLKVAGD